ncbi:MAG: hypothetical protein KKC11_03075 [Candidatus Omnitrophica bacterium]|nr:hypothetical protein [Candidatus Omnitrophota bacterium]MBU1133446.1 hypothetical protein [Candidatus Omnitrophota bacterium]MBU1810501.1 hypothetical protein [Candidatus Omnitrophota bacterium]MBU2437161.1 hypothetical protein [Candidatus Omnitrophota bacterium]
MTTQDMAALKKVPFGQIPLEIRAKVFGVDYVCINMPGRGQLYVTRYGWPWLEHLLPEQWYENQQYYRIGQRLSGSGTVYRVPTFSNIRRHISLVVKFSRFAQDVMLYIESDYPDCNTLKNFYDARFNGPFEEFGILMELRSSSLGPSNLRIRTKRPFAIYCPYEESDPWRMGRALWRFSPYQEAIQKNQTCAGGPDVKLDIRKSYILLFGWVKGENAAELCSQGLLDERELRALTIRVHNELKQKGFHVLDNKPRHFILRKRRGDNLLLHRNGKLVYALVDFELLVKMKRSQLI